MTMLQVENLTVRYGALTVLRDLSFTLEAGEWLMLLGPNGAGKSTTVGALGRGTPYTGTVRFEGTDIRTIRPLEYAKRVGLLTQNHAVEYAFTVEEVVGLGRYAYRGEDPRPAVEEALARTGLTALAKRSVLSLSGGELQRTFFAQVMAQDPKLLILDEPANHLDPLYRKQTLELVEAWRQKPGRAVISVLHDLSLARRYGTRAILLDRGVALCDGDMRTALAPDRLQAAYGMDVAAWMRELHAVWEDA